MPTELRIVFTSSANVTFWYRSVGYPFWVQLGGTYNPGWTPTWVALSSNPESASFGVTSVWRHLWGA